MISQPNHYSLPTARGPVGVAIAGSKISAATSSAQNEVGAISGNFRHVGGVLETFLHEAQLDDKQESLKNADNNEAKREESRTRPWSAK
ncbi:hypothetical protein GCM10007857_76800 [Bradyrhizobium iriomotense]|uniref:CsbD-like domain-containing protein n=1 Tax=Bradyrhizobium iriomotense TaxID=441950 RepID=A0ABQ6BC30_9BRAD|nr:hypothetical protein GCM10007857_76800 [Bradyrhizobium iriomotense]